MSGEPEVDVLFIAFNRPHYTRRSLPALLDSAAGHARVWIWMNGTHPETLEIVRSFKGHPAIHRYHESDQNLGLHAPINWLITEGRGKYFSKVDDDCIVAQDWLPRLIEAHANNGHVGVLGCWRFQPGDFDPSVAGRKIVSLNGCQVLQNLWVEGSGFLARREAAAAAGGFRAGDRLPLLFKRIGAQYLNGWLFPFVPQEHMDDPRSPNTGVRVDADLQGNVPISALETGVTTVAAWDAQLRSSAKYVQAASPDPLEHIGLLPEARARLYPVKRRIYTTVLACLRLDRSQRQVPRSRYWYRVLSLRFWKTWWRRQPNWKCRVGAALMHFGIKSKSDEHETSASRGTVTHGQPIIVIGSPRGGTTTMMRRIGRLAGRPYLFEPFGFNDLRVPSFAEANLRFRLGLPQSELLGLSEWGRVPHQFNEMPEGGRDSAALKAMDAHLRAIEDSVGLGVVWKEIRLLPALDGLLALYRQRGVRPTMFLVKAHPFGTLYSYYRLLGLSSGPGVHGTSVGELYAVRKLCYSKILPSSRWMFVDCPTPAAELVAAIALDQEAIQHWSSLEATHVVSLGTPEEQLSAALDGVMPEDAWSAPFTSTRAGWVQDPVFRRALPSLLGDECYTLAVAQFGDAPVPPPATATLRQRVTGALQWCVD